MEADKKEKLYKLITNTIGADGPEITDGAEFLADLNATDEEVIELVKKVENLFDVELETPVGEIMTVNDLILAIEEAEL